MYKPKYLWDKLSTLGIHTRNELVDYEYIEVFQWLKEKFTTLANNALFDLYCVYHNIPLRSLSTSTKEYILETYSNAAPNYLLLDDDQIYYFLDQANLLAKNAYTNNEIPIGAIVTKDGEIIGRGYNQVEHLQDISAHAEMLAIEDAKRTLGSYRLVGCELFVNIEPCLMCSGAIIHSRIKQVYFGACEPKTGACCSQYKVFKNLEVNHQTQAIGPIDNKYAKLMQQFLKSKRK